jgi:hypothetical protein
MSKRKNSGLLIVILCFLFLMGIFSGAGAGMQELVVIGVLSALIVASFFLICHYYLTDKNSLKQRLVFICISFIKLMIFSVAVKELTGVTLDYSIFAWFFMALTIFTLWEFLDLSLWEKGVLVLVLITALGVKGYENKNTEPSTAYHLYSELSNITRHEEILALLLEDYRKTFTPKSFQDLKPYLDPLQEQRLLRFSRPALLEFGDGQMVMLEVSRADPDNKLRFSNIELLPEEVGSYLRHYPLEIERKADYPKGAGEEEREIIEARGAFVSRASYIQEREWYEKLISVFGEKKVWDDLWDELGGLQAPEGPVRGWGTSKEGYLHFSFCRDWEVDKDVLDEIYARFRDQAAKHNIPDLPVVFEWAD